LNLKLVNLAIEMKLHHGGDSTSPTIVNFGRLIMNNCTVTSRSDDAPVLSLCSQTMVKNCDIKNYRIGCFQIEFISPDRCHFIGNKFASGYGMNMYYELIGFDDNTKKEFVDKFRTDNNRHEFISRYDDEDYEYDTSSDNDSDRCDCPACMDLYGYLY
jgi:hypothetical protein